jgi:hypothetical protein
MVSARQVQRAFATQGITLYAERVSKSRLISETFVPNTDTVRAALLGLVLYKTSSNADKAASLLAPRAKGVRVARIGNLVALYLPGASHGKQVEAAISALRKTAR